MPGQRARLTRGAGAVIRRAGRPDFICPFLKGPAMFNRMKVNRLVGRDARGTVKEIWEWQIGPGRKGAWTVARVKRMWRNLFPELAIETFRNVNPLS